MLPVNSQVFRLDLDYFVLIQESWYPILCDVSSVPHNFPVLSFIEHDTQAGRWMRSLEDLLAERSLRHPLYSLLFQL